MRLNGTAVIAVAHRAVCRHVGCGCVWAVQVAVQRDLVFEKESLKKQLSVKAKADLKPHAAANAIESPSSAEADGHAASRGRAGHHVSCLGACVAPSAASTVLIRPLSRTAQNPTRDGIPHSMPPSIGALLLRSFLSAAPMFVRRPLQRRRRSHVAASWRTSSSWRSSRAFTIGTARAGGNRFWEAPLR